MSERIRSGGAKPYVEVVRYTRSPVEALRWMATLGTAVEPQMAADGRKAVIGLIVRR